MDLAQVKYRRLHWNFGRPTITPTSRKHVANNAGPPSLTSLPPHLTVPRVTRTARQEVNVAVVIDKDAIDETDFEL